MHWIKKVEYIGEYRLILTFETGEPRTVDLKDHLEGPVFLPLKDRSYFRQVSLNEDIDTVAWPNHADFSPDFLYEIGTPVSRQERA